ncbi:zinc carboxypeptidase family protein [[Actinomadura] parvosata subsp. kistnae]|uniref:M14 family zinc carboxypeptidase n=1 Tax=[Actinomadura] parvosata TaxID=1955412 RepID=UPI000D2B7BBD|nr:M14 family zinc carboxypeptidase [Nonomuraea sp. ATCC 55076]SPL96523.1 zinc carboxypeptidase family protein [Actinomadura parvosata subsp. kistnae]
MPDRLAAELDTVPDHKTFATVDEVHQRLARLADDHPGVATLRRIGTSRLGDPMLCLTVGDGPRHAVVAAGPHPNEPIGGLTVTHLASRLCADAGLRRAEGCTWHIVGCLDPDGTRLNEGWFAGPFTRAHYGRHFYRPAGDEQVEWTFPFAYKRAYFDRVLPETLALMRLIDETRPAFLTTLHNGESGGVFYYLNRPEPELQAVLRELPGRYGVPLHAGEAEHPSVKQLEPAFYLTPSMEDVYDYAEALGQDPVEHVGGASSDSYVRKYGTLGLTAEIPYWTDASAGDTTPTGRTYRDVLTELAARLTATSELLDGVLAAVTPELSTSSPFLRATRSFIPMLAGTAATHAVRAPAPENERPATVAEVASCRDTVHSARLRFGGMLLRALEGELAVGNVRPAIRAQARELARTYDRWCAEAEAGASNETIPIRHLVAIQYGAILAGARQAMTTPAASA